ncbi:OmpA-OmpF porin, OOP family [Duganella sacchari]|uniref:OmpA-OmpF porin, OOP family n=1 Tax=Duganella sacchari TaxID=551987 RepID=A0A1M7HV05_9BURK|nr:MULTISPECIES: OmpA family protein [Duganella]MYM27130.1 OmpA family protein [Duganella sp. CY15W]SHM32362.1 OmpA-OmpF porin, OOP family [Duganella sacchari]
MLKILTLLTLLTSVAAAQTPGQIVATGAVPDEASKAGVLAQLRALYGADRVVDQLTIAQVSLPPNWNAYVQKLISPNLKLVSKGELKIDGTNVTLRGEVANEVQRQQIASDIATVLNPSYTVNNGLRVSAAEQNLLDTTLARRIIEFESGRATLTSSGKTILDEMALAMQKVKGKRVEVIGHTDNVGLRDSNLALSQARAEAVRTYLSGRGISPEMVLVSGQGPDRPVADNTSAEGRARNRRIEFRVAQ